MNRLRQKHACWALGLTSLLCVACNRDPKFYAADAERTLRNREITDTLQGERLRTQVFGIRDLKCADSLLVLTTANDSCLINVVDVKRDCVVAVFGSKGNARNEFSQEPYICYINNERGGRYLYVSDQITTKVIDLTASVAEGGLVLDDVLKPAEYDIFTIHFYYGKGNKVTYKDVSYEDARDEVYYVPEVRVFQSAEDKGQKVNLYKEIVKTIDPGLQFTAYFSEWGMDPLGIKFVIAHNALDLFSVVDIASGRSIGVWSRGAYGFERFEEIPSLEKALDRLVCYTRDLCVTEHFIFLLQDGRPVRYAQNNDMSGYVPKVKIFDFDGNLRAAFACRERLEYIAFDEQSLTLYGVDDEDYVYRYDLKGSL